MGSCPGVRRSGVQARLSTRSRVTRGESLPPCTLVYPSVNGLYRLVLEASACLPQDHTSRCPSACGQVTGQPRPVLQPRWAQTLPTQTGASSLPPALTSGHSSSELLAEQCEISVGPAQTLAPARIPRHPVQGWLTRRFQPQPTGGAQRMRAPRVREKPAEGKGYAMSHSCHSGVLPTSPGLPELRQGPQSVSTDPCV